MKLDTVLFDMGGTLEEIWYVPEVASVLPERLEQILQIPYASITDEDPEACYKRLQQNYAIYRDFREDTCIEVHPAMVWRDWILKDYGIRDQIVFDHYEELSDFWETEVITRKTRTGINEMLNALHQRGIRMGIISNTGSLSQVYTSLEQYGIRSYFEVVILSSEIGIRKPHPFLFHDALKRMNSDATRAIYVGDTVSRDVVGAKNAGLFRTIQIRSEFTKLNDDASADHITPDYVIHSLMDIPAIVDEINGR